MERLYIALAILLFFSLSYREAFYNPEEPIGRPENFPDHSNHRNFMEIEKTLYALIMSPSLLGEERAYLEDFLNLIQTIPETKPPTSTLFPNTGKSTNQKLQHVKMLLLQEFATLTPKDAAYIPLKNSIYYMTWLLKNKFS
jgi:hypothetical protein